MPKFLVSRTIVRQSVFQRRVMAVAAWCAMASCGFAQQTIAQTPSGAQASGQNQQGAAGQQKSDESQEPTETVKINVNIVQLFFNVKDKHGALIPNLTKDDFSIAEDGTPQTVKYFTAETNLPLTLGILIDSSGSQIRVLDMEKEVGGAFLKQIITDKDEAFVIDFNVDSSLVQDFTRDVQPSAKGAEQCED